MNFNNNKLNTIDNFYVYVKDTNYADSSNNNDIINKFLDISDIFIIYQIDGPDSPAAYLILTSIYETAIYILTLPRQDQLDQSNNKILINITPYDYFSNSLFLSPLHITGFDLININNANNSNSAKSLAIFSLDKGIAIIEKLDTNKSWNLKTLVTSFTNDGQKSLLKAKNFIINKHTMYILIQDYGIKILNTNFIKVDYSLSSNQINIPSNIDVLSIENGMDFLDFNLYHPYMIKIHKTYNPISKFEFVGILIQNQNVDEFYYELNIENEYNPTINKIFKSNTYIDSDLISYDRFFVYIFSKASNQLIVIRHSIINLISEITYMIDVNIQHNNIDSDKPISLLQILDGFLNKQGFLLSNDNNILLLSDFFSREDSLECKFNTQGIYQVIWNSHAETCETNADSISFDNTYCNLYLIDRFLVIEKVLLYKDSLFVALVCICLLLFSFPFIFLIIVKKYCRVGCVMEDISIDNNTKDNNQNNISIKLKPKPVENRNFGHRESQKEFNDLNQTENSLSSQRKEITKNILNMSEQIEKKIKPVLDLAKEDRYIFETDVRVGVCNNKDLMKK